MLSGRQGQVLQDKISKYAAEAARAVQYKKTRAMPCSMRQKKLALTLDAYKPKISLAIDFSALTSKEQAEETAMKKYICSKKEIGLG